MRRLLAAATVMVWLAAPPIFLRAADDPAKPHFQPAEALSVDDIVESRYSIASGTVVLDVEVSRNGEATDIQVRRGIVSLTEVAVRSVKAWTFAPAQLNGNAVASRVTVAFTFNPASIAVQNIPLPALIPQRDEARIQSSYQPPEVTFAAFPVYPIGAAGPGAVILQATIDGTGKVECTQVLQAYPPFTPRAIRAAPDWRFMPATLNGRPLKSKVILAFVFRLAPSPPPPSN